MCQAKFHYDIVYWKEEYDLDQITLYQIGDLSCSPGYEVPLHSQHCYEISYIASGRGVFIIDDKEIPVFENKVILNRPGQKHRIVSSESDPLRYMYLGFRFKEEHKDFEYYRPIKNFFDNTSNWIITDTKNISQCFFNAFSEFITADSLMHEMLKAYITPIIISTYREFTNGRYGKYQHNNKSDEEIVYNILNYIESDNCNINKLVDIGNELGYSYPYLSQLFSNKMGHSIQNHFRQIQFNRAISMMKEDSKITDIAAALGYSTVYSFSRAFSAHYGISPKQYKSKLSETPDFEVQPKSLY